jgi:folate-binding protein YgfZ
LAGHDVILIGRRSLNGIGYLFLVPELAAKEARALLEQSGAKLLTDQEYETMRIESGSPGTKTELTDAYTPFEVGLGYAVDANKGCYTGQEILARQVTYDKITRQLTGLRMEVVADPGAQLMADGKPAGEITSATVSPKFGPIALAVVKRPFFEPGTTLQVKLGEHTIPATTCQLPFIQLDTPLT